MIPILTHGPGTLYFLGGLFTYKIKHYIFVDHCRLSIVLTPQETQIICNQGFSLRELSITFLDDSKKYINFRNTVFKDITKC